MKQKTNSVLETETTETESKAVPHAPCPTNHEARPVSLMEKIRTRTVRAGIIGLGYVGLPLAVEFAKKGIRVTGIDIDSRKVDAVMRGESYIGDVSTDDIRSLIKTTDNRQQTTDQKLKTTDNRQQPARRAEGSEARLLVPSRKGEGTKDDSIDVSDEKVSGLRSVVPASSAGGCGPWSTPRLSATTDFSVIAELDTVDICVPTPLRKSKDPDISYIVAAAEQIVKYLHPGMLIILESTTYPGTTEEVILPMLERTGLKCGQDFYLAFSPERVDPGNPNYQTRNIPKVVGGMTAECTELAAEFYQIAIEKVHKVSSPSAAEMVKLLENTFRIVNIGLVNELCQMSAKLNVNVWEIIDAAATKPFGFMPFYPGPGLGGHCIPIDPHYLAWKARIHGFNPRFIDLAGVVNAEMPEYVVRKAQQILNESGLAMKNARIHIWGVTYKKNISDVRESPALEIIEMLERNGAFVTYSDPFVPEFSLHGKKYRSINLDNQTTDHRPKTKDKSFDASGEKVSGLKSVVCGPGSAFDLSVLITDHAAFDKDQILASAPVVLDTRNMFKGTKSDKVVRI